MAAEPEPTEPLTLALLVGGGAGVGKTSVLRRFLENRFNPASAPTAGVEFLSAPLPPLGSGAHPARLVVCRIVSSEGFASKISVASSSASGVFPTTSACMGKAPTSSLLLLNASVFDRKMALTKWCSACSCAPSTLYLRSATLPSSPIASTVMVG